MRADSVSARYAGGSSDYRIPILAGSTPGPVVMRLDVAPALVHYVRMRLTQTQRSEILRIATEVFGPDATVTLFGSRVDDAARGGDIDLMITTGLDSATARRRKIRFLAKLKQQIGDRRIDVVLRTPDSGERTIHRIALTEGVTIQ